jgi:ABC-type transport system involved in cytochrome c biogenesis permease subunit
VNVTVTVLFAAILTVHVLLSWETESQPLQLLTVESPSGVAVKTTWVSRANDAEQTEPQLIPEGLLVTVPLPVPLMLTVSTGFCVNVAVTDLFASIVI